MTRRDWLELQEIVLLLLMLTMLPIWALLGLVLVFDRLREVEAA